MRDWFVFSAFDWQAAALALAASAGLAFAGWVLSLAKRDVSIVDSLWSLMFLVSLAVYMTAADASGWRAWLILALTAIWALRLSAHITWRSWGEPEDRRYQEIRDNNQPNFRYKSLYLVFGLQAVLAWLISFPLMAAASKAAAPGWLDALGLSLWLAGMFFEVVGDAQLAGFKRNRANRGKVMSSGLWRYTRHPNYFGEFLLQWGFFVLAVPAGGAWTVFAPALMTFLLLRVSGVTLMEKGMDERRPGYRQYIASTNAFFPGRPRPGPDFALFVALSIGLVLPWGQSSVHANDRAETPDREWHFEVLIDDKPIGHHRFYLEQVGERRELISVADFEYRLLFLKLYDYEHENREVWDGACLASIESSTNANGRIYQVEGGHESGAFVVSNGEQRQALPGCVMSFAYWKPEFLEEPYLLNSQTGEYMAVDVTAPVADEIRVGNRTLPTQRYRLTAGELEIDLWYTPEGQWVGLETTASGGRSLRYELQ